MGAIGSSKTYTVTAAKSGWTSNTGSVTLSQYTQGAVTITLSAAPVNGTLQVTYTSSVVPGKTIYIYSSIPLGGAPIASAERHEREPDCVVQPAGRNVLGEPASALRLVRCGTGIRRMTSGNTTVPHISSSN